MREQHQYNIAMRRNSKKGLAPLNSTHDAKTSGKLNALYATPENGTRSLIHGEESIGGPKLPALVIKGSNNDVEQPLDHQDRTLRNIGTAAYALSPKIIKQARLEDKIQEIIGA